MCVFMCLSCMFIREDKKEKEKKIDQDDSDSSVVGKLLPFNQ